MNGARHNYSIAAHHLQHPTLGIYHGGDRSVGFGYLPLRPLKPRQPGFVRSLHDSWASAACSRTMTATASAISAWYRSRSSPIASRCAQVTGSKPSGTGLGGGSEPSPAMNAVQASMRSKTSTELGRSAL